METVRFEEMGISEEIQKAVRYMGFEEASPIQAKAIPAMISGIDLIGQRTIACSFFSFGSTFSRIGIPRGYRICIKWCS